MTLLEAQSLADIVKAMLTKPTATGKAQQTAMSSLRLTGSSYLAPKANKSVGASKPQTGLNTVMNYQDPLELNSFADAMFNRRAINSKAWLRAIPDWTNVVSPVLPIKYMAATADVLYNTALRPIFGDSNKDGVPDWDFTGATINLLGNFGETMDIVANPVKGAVIEGFNMNGSTEGVTALQGFSRGLGMGDEGRTPYNYDTQWSKSKFLNGVTNFALETISDPLNWLEWGAGAAAKSAARKLGSEVLEDAATKASKEFISEVLNTTDDTAVAMLRNRLGDAAADGYKVALEQGTDAVKAYADELSGAMVDTLKNSDEFRRLTKQAARDAVSKGTQLTDELEKTVSRSITNKFSRSVWESGGKKAAEQAVINADILRALKDVSTETLTSRSARIMDAMGKLYRVTDEGQKYLMQGILASNPVGLGVLGAAAVGKKMWGKLASSQYITKFLAKQFKDVNHIQIDELLDWNRALEAVARTDPGKAANLNPIAQTITQGTSAMYDELSDIMDILAKNSDAKAAEDAIAEFIAREHGGKSVQEYLDDLTIKATSPDLSPEIRALFTQHAIKLHNQFDDLAVRIALGTTGVHKALGLIKEEPIAAMNRFFGQLDSIKQLAIDNKWIYDLTNDPSATYDLRTSWDALAKRMDATAHMLDIPADPTYAATVHKLMENFQTEIKHKTGAEIKRLTDNVHEQLKIALTQIPMTMTQRKAALDDLGLLFEDIINSSFAIKTTTQIKIVEDMVGYVVKNSQLNAALHLLNAPGLDNLVRYINSSDGIDAMQKLTAALNQARGEDIGTSDIQIEYIQTCAKNYESQLRFMDKITRSAALTPKIAKIPQEDISRALLDAVQTFAVRPVDDLIQNYPKTISEIYQRILNQVNSGHATQSNKLVDLLYRTRIAGGDALDLWREVQARFGKPMLTFHDADDDAIAALLIAEHTHPEAVGHMFSFDIETSPSKHVIQIAWRYGDEHGNYIVKTPAEMLHDDQALIRKLSGLGDGHTIAEHTAAYHAKYAAGTYTEEGALMDFFRALDRLTAADPEIRLVGHNIKLSDEVGLLYRADRTLVDPGVFGDTAFRKARRIDTYLEEVQRTGHLDFDDEPELAQTISMEMQILLRTRAHELAQLGTPSMPLFDQIDIFQAFAMRSIAGQLDTYAVDPMLAAQLRSTSMTILERLRTLKYTNSKASTTILDKGHIVNLGSALGYDVTEIMGLVNVPEDYLGSLSSHIVVDTSAARTLFKDAYIRDNLFLATEYAKRIGNTYKQLGDVEELLDGETDNMRVLFEHLQARLPSVSKWQMKASDQMKVDISRKWNFKTDWQVVTQSTAKTEALKNLRFPDGTAHQAAALLWLMREVKDITTPKGAANISQTLLTQLRGAIGESKFDSDIARIFGIFDMGYPLYTRKVLKQTASVIDEAKRMAQSVAVMNAETTLKECEVLKRFNNQQYDYIGQFYRFDKRYELAFASDMMQSMDSLLNTVNEFATLDHELTQRQLYSYYDAIGKSAARYVLGLRGDALLAHLQFNAQGVIRIDLSDWSLDKDMIAQVRDFMEEADKLGVGVRLHNRKLWIVRTTSTPQAAWESLAMPVAEDIPRLEEALPEKLLVTLQDTRQKFHALKDGMRKLVDKTEDDWMYNLYSVNSTGTLITSAELEAVIADMPSDLKSIISLPSAPRDTFNFNYSNIGSPATRNLAYNFSPTNPVRAYNSVLQTFLAYGDAALKMRLLLTSDSSFVRFSNLFEDCTDQEILDALQSSRIYRVLMAEQDSSVFGYHVRELRPGNLDDIRMLRNSEAIVVDHNTHRMLRNVFNRGELNNGLAKFFNDVVISPAKAGMLTGIGPVLRNFVDSTLKNYLSLDYSSDAPAFTAHVIESSRWLHIYETDMKQILDMTLKHYDVIKQAKHINIDAMGPSKIAIDSYFAALDLKAKFLRIPIGKLMSETDQDVLRQWEQSLSPAQVEAIAKAAKERMVRKDIFDLTHSFIVYGPSAGVVTEQQKIIETALAAKRARAGKRLNFQEGVKHFAWSNPLTAPLMGVQSKIEQLARYSKFTWELKNDRSVAEAMHRVIETHFDYATKSTATLYMELIVPFYTFAAANLEYWAKLMTKHGWPFGVLRDLYSSFMDFNEYDQYEMQNNRAVQYAILNGTIPLSDTGFALKLSPSYLDAFNILLQPIDSVKQRIAKAIMVPLDLFVQAATGEFSFDETLLKEVMSAIPFLGNYSQRYWNSGDWSLKGSAIRAAEGVDPGLERTLALWIPTVFSDIGKAYYFAYPSKNEVWKTYDENVYFEQMTNGAVPVITNAQAQEIAAREKYTFYYGDKAYSTFNPDSYQEHLANGATTAPQAPMTFYYGEKPYTTYKKTVYEANLAKGATAKPTQKKTFVSFRTLPQGYSRRFDLEYDYDVRYRNFGSQVRQRGSTLNLSHIAPAVWRRVYTAGANDRFKVRLTKPTAKNLQYRIRMDWRYWR